MAIENTVCIDFLFTFQDSIRVFDCRLPGVKLERHSLTRLKLGRSLVHENIQHDKG